MWEFMGILREAMMQHMLSFNILIFTEWLSPPPQTTIIEWKKPGGPKCIWAGQWIPNIINNQI